MAQNPHGAGMPTGIKVVLILGGCLLLLFIGGAVLAVGSLYG